MAWTPWVLPGLVSLAAGWTVAALVYRAAPTSAANRRAAATIVLASTVIGLKTAVLVLMPTRLLAYWAFAAYLTLLFPTMAALLWLIGTLDTPLARPFRGRVAFVVLAAAVVGVEWIWAFSPELFVTAFRTSASTGWWTFSGGPLLRPFAFYGPAIVMTYSLAASLHSLWRTRHTARRETSIAYAAAFGVRDLIAIGTIIYFLEFAAPPTAAYLYMTLYPLEDITFLAILGYGILRTQLFDFDARFKAGVKRSLVLAPFLIVFFVASEATSLFVEGVAGTAVGIFAAAVLAIAFRPLERMATRLADRAMPNASAPDHLLARRLAVYRVALEGAAVGGVTAKERGSLARLAQELGISPDEARALEDRLGAPAA